MSLKEIEELERKVKRSIYFAAIVVILIISVFIIKIWFLSGNQLSSDPEKWGQFGDYIGGLLNPLLAFIAFYWLTQSVLIQKQELLDTKKALQESAAAQLKQEIHAGKTARINALNSLLASCNSDITNLRNSIEFLSRQLLNATDSAHHYYSLTGQHIESPKALQDSHRKNLDEFLKKIDERNKLISQIKRLLDDDISQ